MGQQPDQAYRQTVAELCTAAPFSSEVDPDTIQLIQMETIDNLLTFGELLDNSGSDAVERMAEASSGPASYLDGLVEGSFHSHPSEQSHRRYLAGLADTVSGKDYFATRHSVIESSCLGALQDLPDAGGLLDSAAGRELLALCEEFGEELVTTMRWLRRTGRQRPRPEPHDESGGDEAPRGLTHRAG